MYGKRTLKMSQIFVVLLFFTIPLSGCISNSESEDELIIVTYDVLALTDEMIAQFENETGISVTLIKLDDTGSILDYLIKTNGTGSVDLAIGLDNTYLQTAIELGVLAEHQATGLDMISDQALGPYTGPMAVPYDMGYVCLNYDSSIISKVSHQVSVLFPDNETLLLDSHLDMLPDENITGWNLTESTLQINNISLNYSLHETYGNTVNGINDIYEPSDWSWWWSLYLWNESSEAWEESSVGIDSVIINQDTNHIAWAASNANSALIPIPSLDLPTDLWDLTEEKWRGKVALPSPVTSSPGRAFMLATLDYFSYSENSYSEFEKWWGAMVENDVIITSGWTEAYEIHYSGGYGEYYAGYIGDAHLTVSYCHSPGVESWYNENWTKSASLDIPKSSFFQVEYAASVNGGNNNAASLFIEYLLSENVNSLMPSQNLMYSVLQGENLPEEYGYRYNSIVPQEPAEISMVEIEQNMELWLQIWNLAMTQVN